MVDRRTFFGWAAASLATRAGWSSTEDWQQALTKAISDQNSLSLGHRIPPATDASWAEVDDILARAPSRNTTPLAIANYFVTSVPLKYQQAWPEPDPANPTDANPLIVRLFLSTHTQPQGDVTAWCAAFVNWCLRRCDIERTSNASSQSFLKWGHSVWEAGHSEMPIGARPGDIAVFRLRSDPEHGHVAFFAGLDTAHEKRVRVVGGNQIRGHGTTRQHLIDFDSFRVDANLELVAIRTANGLRDERI